MSIVLPANVPEGAIFCFRLLLCVHQPLVCSVRQGLCHARAMGGMVFFGRLVHHGPSARDVNMAWLLYPYSMDFEHSALRRVNGIISRAMY